MPPESFILERAKSVANTTPNYINPLEVARFYFKRDTVTDEEIKNTLAVMQDLAKRGKIKQVASDSDILSGNLFTIA